MDTTGVSVIIPTYNRGHLVKRAIMCALGQVGPHDEILVADDGSTDGTAEAVRPFLDRVRYLPLSHGGAGATRNRAVAASTRPLMAFLDSDDEWYPGKLALQRAFMVKRADVVFSCTDFCSKLADNTEEHHYLARWHNDPRPWDEIISPGQFYSEYAELPPGWPNFRVHIGSFYLAEMESDYVATSTVMVRRSLGGDVVRFAEDLGISEDKQYYSRLARLGPAAYLDCETSWQHGHGGPRLTDNNAYAYASARIKLLKRIWGSDPEFCTVNGDRLERALSGQYLKRATWLMARGRLAEGRTDLRTAKFCPLSYRLLARLPRPAVSMLLTLRRLARSED